MQSIWSYGECSSPFAVKVHDEFNQVSAHFFACKGPVWWEYRAMKAFILSCCAILALIAFGCAKKTEVDTAKLEKSFATAEPADKGEATKVVDAVKAGDYNAALASLKTLAQQAKLTPEQKSAIEDVTAQVQKVLSETISKAAEGGQKALEDAKKSLPK
jgi:hypothetical protein